MNIREYNRTAWDKQVQQGNEWTVPVSTETIAAARRGQWNVVLTEEKPVPRSWFPDDMQGVEILGLASGGGQQSPIFAAAGAHVTVLDNSPGQLGQDRYVAERDGLELKIVEGDMADLSMFDDASFDLVFHPCSNLFVPDVLPVWNEAFRVLRHGGILLAGFLNPAIFIFDLDEADKGVLQVRHRLPYADTTSLEPEELERFIAKGVPLEFSHTLDDLIGGQLDAGFLLTGFYEDRHRTYAPGQYMPTYIATRAIKA
jgi:SAM-dependent methyltransferase